MRSRTSTKSERFFVSNSVSILLAFLILKNEILFFLSKLFFVLKNPQTLARVRKNARTVVALAFLIWRGRRDLNPNTIQYFQHLQTLVSKFVSKFVF